MFSAVNTKNKLFGCINDAQNIQKFLINKCGYNVNNVVLLTDDNPDHLPTIENILKHFEWLVKDSKKGDHLFFSYSGHGTQIKDTTGDEKDGKDEVIIPCDYNYIVDDLIRTELCEKIPEGCQLFALMDCCNSGTNFDLRYSVQVVDDRKLTLISDKHYKKTDGQVIMISGCKDNQSSADAYLENESTGKLQAQGAMSNAFLHVMYYYNCDLHYKRLLKKMRKYVKK